MRFTNALLISSSEHFFGCSDISKYHIIRSESYLGPDQTSVMKYLTAKSRFPKKAATQMFGRVLHLPLMSFQ